MFDVRYLDVNDLPPRPEPETGRPVPPHAPGYPVSDQEAYRLDTTGAPAAPAGQGSTLAWVNRNRKDRLRVSAMGLVFMAGVFSIVNGVHWLEHWRYWPLWVILVGTSALLYVAQRGACAAGAEWLSYRNEWVKLYELDKITCNSNVGNVDLTMKDSDGRKLSVKLADLQRDRLLWDLVYNGVLHSVIARRAETNGQLHHLIHVPYPRPAPE